MTRLLQTLGLRNGEGNRLFAASAVNFLIMLSLYLARAARDALFYSEIGPQYLPYMFIGVSFFALFSNEAFSRAAGIWAQHKIFQGLLLLGTMAFISIYLVLEYEVVLPSVTSLASGPIITYALIYITTELLAVLLVVTTAAFVNDAALFDLGAIKRLSPYYVAAGHLGGLVSGLVAFYFAKSLGVVVFFAISAVLLITVFIYSRWVVRKLYRYRLNLGSDDEDVGSGFVSDVALILKNKYLLVFSAITICNFFLGSSFEWILSESATTATESDPDELAAFLGFVNIAGGAVAILFQVALIGNILSKYGVANANLGAPIFLLIGAGFVALNPSYVWFAVFARGFFFVAENAFNQTLIRFIYNVVRERDRLRVQGFIESNIITLSIALTGLVLLLVDPEGASLSVLGYFVVIVAGVMLWLSVKLKALYTDEARKNYLSLSSLGKRELFEDVFKSKDDTSAEIVEYIYRTGDPDTQRQAIEVVSRQRLVHHHERFIVGRLTEDWPREVRLSALAALKLFNRPDDASVVEPLLSDPDPAIVVAALETNNELTGTAIRIEQLQSFLDGGDPDIASSALVQLMQNGGVEGMKAGINTLELYRKARSKPKRLALIKTFGKLGQSTIDDLLELLKTATLDEKTEIISALGTIPNRRVYAHILEFLLDPSHIHTARTALLRQPAFFVDLVLETFNDIDTSNTNVRRNLAWVLARIRPTEISEEDGLAYNMLITDALLDGLQDRCWSVRMASAEALSFSVMQKNVTSISTSVAENSLLALAGPFTKNAMCMENILARQSATVGEFSLVLKALKDIEYGHQNIANAILQATFPEENLATVFQNLQIGDLREESVELLENILPRKIFRAFTSIALYDPDINSQNGSTSKTGNLETVWKHLASFNEESLLFSLYHPWEQGATERVAFKKIEATELGEKISNSYRENEMASILDRAQILAQAKLFSNIQIGDLIEIARNAKILKVQAGENIYEIGTPSEGLFVVAEGSVGLNMEDKSGEIRQINIIDRGASFGEVSVVSGDSYSEIAQAIDKSVCIIIPRADVTQLLAIHPHVYDDLTGIINSRLLNAYDEVINQMAIGRRIETVVRDLIGPSLENLSRIPDIEKKLDRYADERVIVNVNSDSRK